MRIALAQLNFHVGNFPQNSARIIAAIEKAKMEGASLVVFSELSVCGYYPNDLLERLEFVTEALAAIEMIAASCQGIASAITPVPGGVGPMTIACLLENTLKAASLL